MKLIFLSMITAAACMSSLHFGNDVINGAPPEKSVPNTWFANRSPWNARVGNVAGADYSNMAINEYVSRDKTINMNWGSAGVYVVQGFRDSPKTNIQFKDGFGVEWLISNVPIPEALITAASHRLRKRNTDGMTCLIDTPGKRFLSFWQPRPVVNGIEVTTGGASPFSAMGWARVGRNLPSLGRAAGANYCGGLIREAEMRQGVINHALALAWPKDLIRAPKSPYGALQYPASNTDGINMTSMGAVPMGARIQLDPSLSDTQLSLLGLSRPADKIIAHALQKYGGYVVDSNTPTMGGSFYFESKFDDGSRIYSATNPWPLSIIRHFRFTRPPAEVELDKNSPDRLLPRNQ